MIPATAVHRPQDRAWRHSTPSPVKLRQWKVIIGAELPAPRPLDLARPTTATANACGVTPTTPTCGASAEGKSLCWSSLTTPRPSNGCLVS